MGMQSLLSAPPINRREMLRQSCAGFGMLALHGLLGSEASAASLNPLAAKQPHFPAKAKRMIFLLMKGGPSQVDTFDPKPLLDRDHGKPPPFALPRVTFAKTGNLLKLALEIPPVWPERPAGERSLPACGASAPMSCASSAPCTARIPRTAAPC
jgi:hypothetical protein